MKLENTYCNPDNCDQCIYIGEGDSMCDVTHEIVLSDWAPTDAYMGDGCLYVPNSNEDTLLEDVGGAVPETEEDQ